MSQTPISVVKEKFGESVRFHYVPETDKFYAHGNDLAKALLFSNPSDALARNVWSEYRFKIAVGVGQPAWYLSEPGIYQLIFASKHPTAVAFQKWVFEDVLPKLRASGGYIMPNATSEQLEALQAEIEELKSGEYTYNLIKEFAINNLKFVPGQKVDVKTQNRGCNYVMFNDVYMRWHKWSEYNHIKTEVSQTVLAQGLDRYFKALKLPQTKRIFISKSNGYGDLENCKLIPFTKAKNFLNSGVYQIGE